MAKLALKRTGVEAEPVAEGWMNSNWPGPRVRAGRTRLRVKAGQRSFDALGSPPALETRAGAQALLESQVPTKIKDASKVVAKGDQRTEKVGNRVGHVEPSSLTKIEALGIWPGCLYAEMRAR